MEWYSQQHDGDISPGERVIRWGKQWVAHSGHASLGVPHATSVARRRTSRLKGKGGDMVELDGSRGEGGGQILRSALTLSMSTGRSFTMKRIRANRDKPGLRPQHLAAVEAAAALCAADISGGNVGSRALTFRPKLVDPRDFSLDIGTAGATALVLQTLHLPLAMKTETPVRLVLKGGTFNVAAPSYPFLATTWLRHLRMLGLKANLTMPSAGFYPLGGGRIEAWIEPGQPQAMVADRRGEFVGIYVEAGVCRLTRSIADRMIARVEARLAERGIKINSQIVEWSGKGSGTALSLTVEHEKTLASFVGLGERGKSAEAVADEAVAELLAHLDVEDAAVDLYSADQLLLPLALAEGKSIYTTSEITEHLRTNVGTIQEFLDRPIVLEDANGSRPARVVVG